ncbi:bifunctional diaminohydroxyphosphoribosylaminopyrimidine deaminase/5-amino-6-(5-phosphoribosylamino)uracil reductase RibD [Limosilactobacillus sp.]|jgi:diaminohydroxyphosphoribosylaminopyrimidine deaminase/5-amino-6-(5-phosphoribosylamino)uracil reductase|uniref:bifunctional diaminohydroxyphosphoribosylaminopyrimidine deaminase/5-amino-6-(5-phosphoribosylamino)uracil reductase RibD n=1 Tax=Limosilactobacillus sp. TaxID=2773925 RepID=UPI0025C6B342|nr:bifunctional diaminohydroxyphosphoribosylaminopyrimidine deaminase/5-amino-6-(5-phosphoribosylamino)uracil reductase RibD [Limosilactobacillus sp.]MCH3921667.1 bifunctional diaminohydroxyphosphoribosylaminopyrimidine deaminase/5-amino-6-(5-phosphoribosylamino)uracil reductase RibD [Limosilactobacillus sp.]MCH3928438.1 bifunctional diaminohydroxyphosphoribosylaminopyrimidine deaminase/5-amino-6-(5-phosphoribosylamino)uracil reductase RibD [Limosilactobacillus sp.]
MQIDEKMMRLAIKQAQLADWSTWQNPRVGAVVVKNSRVLATGHTHAFGDIHAERDAISKLSPEQLLNSTLYVTLEPCNHYGKQPPCADLIVASGINRVVIAETDPHALVTGKGIRKLQDHGITVETGMLENEAAAVNPHYNFYFRHRRPWVTLKQALSLDGKVTSAPGTRTAITNRLVYERVHQERAWFHGIVIGSQTAIVDDPLLTTTARTDFPPVRIILDRRGRLGRHRELRILHDRAAPTWVFTANPALSAQLATTNATVICQAHPTIAAVVKECGRRGLQSLYVEGGPTIHRAVFDSGLVNELLTYLSPRLLGQQGLAGFQPAHLVTPRAVAIEQLGDNVRIEERVDEDV